MPYPDEYCIYLDELTDEEINSVTDLKGRPINLDEFKVKLDRT